ncbi:MAG: MoxR family ATPase [Gemmatimonadaceae bacterium]
MSDWRVYGGRTAATSDRQLQVRTSMQAARRSEDPAGYLAEPGLSDAVNVAIALGQPLLLTGEPGTGKTRLAYSIAFELLGASVDPLLFNTKTNSVARDLFYQYDALRHFRDSQMRNATEPRVEDYISYQALGRAILLAMPRDEVLDVLDGEDRETPQRQSVVLIDEIDKAPRDLPNDVLDEIEQMRFEVRETGRRFRAPQEFRPILVLTSNSEKMLPDPFLRRCVFYHVSFPKKDELMRIVESRLGGDATRPAPARAWLEQAIKLFEELRQRPLKKKPATAELLSWVRMLDELEGLGDGNPLRSADLRATYPALVKTREDLEALHKTPLAVS